jgi:hypothetical protein
LKGFLWFKSNEKEVVGKMVKAMNVGESEAAEAYQASVKTMSADGTIPRALQEKMIAFQRKALKVEREVAPEQVYDFTILRAINKEAGR